MNSIILIDDQPIANFITRKLLEVAGFKEQVLDFTNPLKALKFVGEKQASLIFLDLNMPIMNGWEFLDSLNLKKHPHKIIILTSSTSEIDLQKSKEYPSVVEYVEKPLNKDKISELSFLLQQVK